MPRVHFVKKARKDNPAVKAGESYHWWSTRMTYGKRYVSTKHYSAAYPKRSRLTNSDFNAQLWDIEDDQIAKLSELGSKDDVESEVSTIVDALNELADEQEEKLGNMPEGLQQGYTGEMLQSRADSCHEMADELEGVDLSDYDEGSDQTEEEWLAEKIEEMQNVGYNGE